MPVPPKHLRDVFELFAKIKNVKKAEMLLRDILTPQDYPAGSAPQVKVGLTDPLDKATINNYTKNNDSYG